MSRHSFINRLNVHIYRPLGVEVRVANFFSGFQNELKNTVKILYFIGPLISNCKASFSRNKPFYRDFTVFSLLLTAFNIKKPFPRQHLRSFSIFFVNSISILFCFSSFLVKSSTVSTRSTNKINGFLKRKWVQNFKKISCSFLDIFLFHSSEPSSDFSSSDDSAHSGLSLESLLSVVLTILYKCFVKVFL